MKRLIGFLAVTAILIAGKQVLRQHRAKSILSLSEKQTLRDAVGPDDKSGKSDFEGTGESVFSKVKEWFLSTPLGRNRPQDVALAEKITKGAVQARIDDAYFEDIHADHFSTCFRLVKGRTYQLGEHHVAQGIEMFEIRDPATDLYQWMPKYRLIFVGHGAREAKVSDEYFRDIHANEFSSCFNLIRGKDYQVSAVKTAQGIRMLKIRDSDSDLYQWMPDYRLKIK